MTVNSGTYAINTYITYSSNIGDKFEITFKFIANDENIKVFVRDENFSRYDLVLDTDYSLTIKDGTDGIYGEIEILKELKDIKSLSIIRDIPISQDVVFDSQTVFSGTTETALDKLTMIAQDNHVLSRSLHVSDDDVVNEGDLELPLSIAGSGVVYRDEKGKFHVGEYGEVSRALRQESAEFPDETFALNKFARSNKYLCFDDNGSVDLREILKSGTHVTIDEDGKLDTTNLSTVAYSGSYNDLSDKLVAGNGINISDNNVISAHLASKETAGLVKIGDNISVDSAGEISIPIATKTNKGVVSVGSNISLSSEDGKISIPTATESVAGIIQIGKGINVLDGNISVAITQYEAGDGISIDSNYTISAETPTASIGSLLSDIFKE